MLHPTPAHSGAIASGKANPHVQVFPSADGTVLIVGVTAAGKWVAEYRCLAEDFDAKSIEAMERRVKLKEQITALRTRASARPALRLLPGE